MTIKKFGTGKVLEEEQQGIDKSAKKDWTEKDSKELARENQDD